MMSLHMSLTVGIGCQLDHILLITNLGFLMVAGLQKQQSKPQWTSALCHIAYVLLTKESPTVKGNCSTKTSVSAGREHIRAWETGSMIIGDY